MISSHNYTQPMGTCRGTALLQLFNFVNEKYTGISGINNVETSPALVAPHFLTLPINSKSLLMKNVVAPNLGGSLSQCFSRLTQQAVFAFLKGYGKVEELPCLDSPHNKIPNGLNKIMPAVEKDDQEITQVKDVVPSQSSIFDFLKGDVRQFLIFLVDFDLGSEKVDSSDLYDISNHLSLLDLSSSSDGSACLDDTSYSIQDNDPCSTTSHEPQLTDHYARAHDDVEWMFTDAVVKDDGCSGEMDENILYSPFHHWHKMFKDDPLSDFVISANGHQYHGSENCHGIMSKLNCNAEIFEQTFKFALEKHGFVTGNYHEETVTRIKIFLPNSESLVPPADKEHNKNCVSTLTHHHSFDPVSDPQNEWTMEIHKETISHCGNTNSLNDCGTSGDTSSEVFGTLEQHPVIGTTEEFKFSIPDSDELMKYLHDTISSPKFLTPNPLNGESDNFQFSSLLRNHNSDEVAKSDNLSDSTTNSTGVTGKNGNQYGLFDTLDYVTESGIGATRGAFGELENASIPSLPDTSQIETIRWNWSIREVNSSAFDLDDHEDLLELYGFSEQDVPANDEIFCDPPTWPAKQ